MDKFKVGDIVTRKSYGGDILFKIHDIKNIDGAEPVYILRGLLLRLSADSRGHDLVLTHPSAARPAIMRNIQQIRKRAYDTDSYFRTSIFQRVFTRPGRILHIDSSSDYLDMCIKYYRERNVKVTGTVVDESRQPEIVRQMLEKYKPDILVLTGHDAMKKDSFSYSLDSYRNSRYFVQSVKEARQYEPDLDRLCVFSGACQSYFEAIMKAGANFASSPGRILINALDPAIVSGKIALTDSRKTVAPDQIAAITVTGGDGIGGIGTKGRMSVC